MLALPEVACARSLVAGHVITSVIRSAQERARTGEISPDEVEAIVVAELAAARDLHSDPGSQRNRSRRAHQPGARTASPVAVEALILAAGYVDVELIWTPARAANVAGARELQHWRPVRAAEEAPPSTTGAAALVLATTTLAAGREVVVSRGELIEIGAGFRLPDPGSFDRARLREVGTTNRTHLHDYATAIGPDTGCVLKVHPSNFRVTGFTSSVSVRELSALSAERGVPSSSISVADCSHPTRCCPTSRTPPPRWPTAPT